MKLTQNCMLLMDFFIKNNFINHDENENNKKLVLILHTLYNDIYNSYKKLLIFKKTNIYEPLVKKINNINQISKPKFFNNDSFPDVIRKHIDKHSTYEITYIFSLMNRNIKVHFIIENNKSELKIDLYNKYLEWIIIWLFILNDYSSKLCSKNLVIYFYFTSLKKSFPNNNIDILDQHNVNTAFTSSCSLDSEIIIFRKEEWFKVFIHETFHSFGLDFSDMNNVECHSKILSIFKVKSDVNLYESYTEYWAEIMNCLFCSFFLLKDKDKENFNEFFKTSEYLINLEKTHSFFQLVKVLKFMGLTYQDLYSNKKESIVLRNNLYKEKTNVLAYYVIKMILLNHYPEFLSWCSKHNISLLAFKKTIKNQMDFCSFIEKFYKSNSMLNGISITTDFLNNVHHSENISKNINKKKNNKEFNYLMNNLRMTLCEMG